MATNSKKSLTIRQRIDLITRIENGEPQTSVCKRLNISKSTVNSIWKNRKTLKRSYDSSEISVDCKRIRSSNFTQVDTALLEWFKQARDCNIPITGKILMEKAQFFATAMNVSTFIATTGFIDRWKRRHSIGMKQISGEEKSVSEEDIRPWLDLTLPELLLKYTPENIYNVDETALFYKLRPDRTLTFKGEKCSGSKKQKDRLTVLVGASMAGEKLPLLVIGKSKSPRCFAGIRSLPLDYISNAKAWMTENFFREWLEKWNRKIVSTKRSVLLIIDNCPAHPRNLELSNISIKFLPPNTTAKLQPCDQGIIQSLKVHYRHQLVKKLLSSMDAKEELKITVLDAMQWLKVAWDKVTATTIQNCFHHCSFSLGSNTAEISIVSEEEPESITYEELKSRDINVEGSFKEYAIIDNDVPVSGILTDNEITAMVQGDVTEEPCIIEHDEDDSTIVCPSVSEYRDAMKIVKRYVTCNSKSCLLNAINEMEELIYTCSVKQSLLSDFYTSQ